MGDDIVEEVKFLNAVIDIIKFEENDAGSINEAEQDFYQHVVTNILDDDEANEHLLVSVYSYKKLTMAVPFLLHILLSMGDFHTELDLVLHTFIRESLWYAKLIGPSDDEADLQRYSNRLLHQFIEEQMMYFPNSLCVVCDWIVIAGDLFDNMIVHNSTPITDLPPVQQSMLFSKTEEEIEAYRK
eukprot:2883172-Ditylum_brightwellii.AAC.1